MKFFIDTANLDEIREAAQLGIIDGVTTNPSLVAKAGDSDALMILDRTDYSCWQRSSKFTVTTIGTLWCWPQVSVIRSMLSLPREWARMSSQCLSR